MVWLMQCFRESKSLPKLLRCLSELPQTSCLPERVVRKCSYSFVKVWKHSQATSWLNWQWEFEVGLFVWPVADGWSVRETCLKPVFVTCAGTSDAESTWFTFKKCSNVNVNGTFLCFSVSINRRRSQICWWPMQYLRDHGGWQPI